MSLNCYFNLSCGMVEYSEEESKDLILLTECSDFAFKCSNSSLKYFRIHILLTPLLAYAVLQYFCRNSLTAVKLIVRIRDRGLVEHLVEPAMNPACMAPSCDV